LLPLRFPSTTKAAKNKLISPLMVQKLREQLAAGRDLIVNFKKKTQKFTFIDHFLHIKYNLSFDQRKINNNMHF
jgi:hypothetical protein